MGDVQNSSSSEAFTNRSLSVHPELSTCPFIALFLEQIAQLKLMFILTQSDRFVNSNFQISEYRQKITNTP